VVVWTHEVVGAFLQSVALGAVELLERLYACRLVEDLAALRQQLKAECEDEKGSGESGAVEEGGVLGEPSQRKMRCCLEERCGDLNPRICVLKPTVFS